MLFPERPITVEHIRSFCANFNEGYRVEYKRNFDANVREKVPKVLASFANSHGGVLVVGVNAPNGVPQPPFEGFERQPREEFPLTVENICLQGIYPPLLPRTTVVDSDIAGRVFLIIEVDESAQAPHAIENSTKVYVRTGNAANPYDLANVDSIFELAKRRKDPFELRARLIERAKKRFSTHIETKRAVDPNAAANSATFLRLSIGPRFPIQELCQYEDLASEVDRNGMNWRGARFPSVHSSLLSQYESAVVLDAARGTSIFEVNVWGLLFYGVQMSVQQGDRQGIGIVVFLGYVLFFVRHAARMLSSLGYSGPVSIAIGLNPIRKVPWIIGQHPIFGPNEAEGSPIDDELVVEVSTSTEALFPNQDSVAKELFRQVLFSVNCSDLVDTDGKLDGLIRQGYAFNYWQR